MSATSYAHGGNKAVLEQVIQKFAQQLPWSDKAQMLQKVLQSEDTGVCSWLSCP